MRSGEDPSMYPTGPENVSTVGMTRSDLFYRGRWWILGIVLLIIGIVVTFLVLFVFKPSLSFSSDGIMGFFNEYGGLIALAVICRIIFGQIGRIATERFLTVPSKSLVMFDFRGLTGAIVSIPEPLFKQFATTGHCLTFRWRTGEEFYFARNIDREKWTIDFGWPHKIRIEEAAVLLDSMQAREKDYARLKEENILLRRYPKVLAAHMARFALDKFMGDMDKALCLGPLDIDEYLNEIDPLSSITHLENEKELRSAVEESGELSEEDIEDFMRDLRENDPKLYQRLIDNV